MTELTDVCNFADDTSFHACDSRLEHDANLATKWFDCNCMKQNEEKCHLIISGHKSEAIWAKIG